MAVLQSNEMLQALHSNLSADYEDRMSQFSNLKNEHKKLCSSHRGQLFANLLYQIIPIMYSLQENFFLWFSDLKEKFEVLRSEKEVVEKQNSSLKQQRNALMASGSPSTDLEDCSPQHKRGVSSVNELEDRLEKLKVANSNLKMMNSTLMEAFEKLKKEREGSDVKRTEVRQLQRDNSELRSEVTHLHSLTQQLHVENDRIKYDFQVSLIFSSFLPIG